MFLKSVFSGSWNFFNLNCLTEAKLKNTVSAGPFKTGQSLQSRFISTLPIVDMFLLFLLKVSKLGFKRKYGVALDIAMKKVFASPLVLFVLKI